VIVEMVVRLMAIKFKMQFELTTFLACKESPYGRVGRVRSISTISLGVFLVVWGSLLKQMRPCGHTRERAKQRTMG
jgi:hypothetical protein